MKTGTKRIAALFLSALGWIGGGCQEMRVTDPPRTATEQYLVSVAARRAAKRVAADALKGKRVYVDDRYFGPDQPYLIPKPGRRYMLAELRAQLLEAGARPVRRREDADAIVSVFTGGLGIDRLEFLLGIPTGDIFALLGGTGDTVENAPDIGLEDRREYGTAGLRLVAYWADTGDLIAYAGPNYGRSFKQKYGFLEGLNTGDSNIPTTRTAEELEERAKRRKKQEESANPRREAGEGSPSATERTGSRGSASP